MAQLQEYLIYCPYCGEIITVLVDTSAGDQQYHEDCQICCAPIFFDLKIQQDDRFTLTARREDD